MLYKCTYFPGFKKEIDMEFLELFEEHYLKTVFKNRDCLLKLCLIDEAWKKGVVLKTKATYFV